MPTLRKRLKRNAVYYVARFLILVLNVVPRPAALWVGKHVGLLAWRMIPRDRRNIDQNLQAVYGDELSARNRAEIGRNFFINSGKNLIDVLRFQRHYRSELSHRVQVEGLEHFDKAYRAGKGLIGITGHLGNFELLAVHIAALGYDIAVIGRELYDARLNDLLVANRTAMGLANIATTDSPKRILQWLKSGKALGVLIDTDSMRVRNLFVPFFGRPAATPVGQSVIGLRTGAAFLPMACLRTAGDQYKIIVKPPIQMTPSGDFETDVYNVTLLCNKALEELIDSHRDQWIWLHNRWNARPENTA